MTVLIVGGAGYIGSHIVRLLADAGQSPVIVDNLSTGDRERNAGVPHTKLDVAVDDAAVTLAKVMRDAGVTAVVHLAALKQVGESVAEPTTYFRSNIVGLANVIDAMREAGLRDIVLSSTAAVYGEAVADRVTEDMQPSPVNPYGWSKWAGERMLAHAAESFGLRATSLRYFNVAGAGWPDLGDHGVSNLVPIVLDRLARGAAPLVYGADFPTADGTGVRDYVHVLDIAEAHLAALAFLSDREPGHEVFNLGTGRGSSVLEVVAEASSVVGSAVAPQIVARRAGDPASVVADVTRVAEMIGWRARFTLADIISSAWAARSSARGARVSPSSGDGV